jgi:AbrB family looped-hinge helix DNA binding protein
MLEYRTRLQDGGRLVIPADFRRELSLSPGEEIILRVREGELLVSSVRQALSRMRKLVKKYGHKKRMVDSLIAARRREAARE